MTMSVGSTLQQARTGRKLTLAQVTEATKIQPWVLEAIESDKVQQMMSPIYARGFVATYARFLKVDSAPLLAALAPLEPQAEAAVLPPPAPARATPAVQRQAATPPPAPSLPPLKLPEFRLPELRLPRIPMPLVRRIAVGAVACAAVAAVIAVNPVRVAKQIQWPALPKVTLPKLAMPKISLPKFAAAPAKPKAAKTQKTASAKPASKPAAPAAAKPIPAVQAASVTPVAEPIKPPALPAPQLASVAPLQLEIEATRTTWIQIKADGKLLTQQRLSRGARERWTAKKQFEVVVSKPSQVELSLNGQSISPFAIAHRGRLLITHRGVVELPSTDR